MDGRGTGHVGDGVQVGRLTGFEECGGGIAAAEGSDLVGCSAGTEGTTGETVAKL